jgi:YebC/PmpR family DNA-binding regulatory protein
MAGHSKWANIRFRKGAQDAKRGKIFTKLIREITVAAKMGGPDENANARLRDAISKALKANMKRDTIENAIKRGSGGGDGVEMMEMRYEGYGPSGVAILVDCLSDNKNRTVSEVRHAFSKCGGNLGTDGSVAYLFNKQGQILLSLEDDENTVMELAIEAGADDVLEDGSHFEVITSPESYHEVCKILEQSDVTIEHGSITMNASTLITLDEEGAQKLLRLVDMLEDLDDVQNVYTNADISQETLEKLT